jgi:hypothetical protein
MCGGVASVAQAVADGGALYDEGLMMAAACCMARDLYVSVQCGGVALR